MTTLCFFGDAVAEWALKCMVLIAPLQHLQIREHATQDCAGWTAKRCLPLGTCLVHHYILELSANDRVSADIGIFL